MGSTRSSRWHLVRGFSRRRTEASCSAAANAYEGLTPKAPLQKALALLRHNRLSPALAMEGSNADDGRRPHGDGGLGARSRALAGTVSGPAVAPGPAGR